jgi:hypothetical protein
MAINWSTQVYAPQYSTFARPVTFTPTKSQPSESAYSGRGIYGTVSVDVIGEDQTIISDARTILDVLESDFSVVPVQGDRVNIPANIGMPALGEFEITDANTNGGGETTLFLRKWLPASIP